MATLLAPERVSQVLFFLSGCSMLALLICNVSIHGLPSPTDLFIPWRVSILINLYINIAAISVWICFKEGNLHSSIIWVVLLVCFRSITACAYIVLQFSKLTAREALETDPVDYVMVQNPNRDAIRQKSTCSHEVVGRVVFSTLAILMLGTVIYSLATYHSSHVRKELLTAWVVTLKLDRIIIILVLVAWVNYKEMPSCVVGSLMWTVLLMLFGSHTTCCYIVTQLLKLNSQDPFYLVFLRNDYRERIANILPISNPESTA